MARRTCKTVGLILVLALALVGGVQAQQQHEQHHPGGAQAPQQALTETSPGAPAQPQQLQGMMENMQGMMQHMQGMMERMQGMMGRQGMGGMMRRHMERLVQQLELTDDQRAQVRTLLGNHAKEVIRLRADIGVMAVDVRQLLEADPLDLPKAKQLLQSIASKEVDLRVAHITLMQEVSKLLTPEQHQKFRTMRESMMGPGGMRGMMSPSGRREPGGMMGQGRRER